MPSKSQTEGPYFLQNTIENLNAEESPEVAGTIPQCLQGLTILMIAPALFNLPKGSFNSWVDGLPLTLNFSFKQSTVVLLKRFLKSNAYKQSLQAEKPIAIDFGNNPFVHKGMLSKLRPFTPSDLTDSCLGTIVHLGGKHPLLFNESLNYYRVDGESLKTLGKFSTLKSFGLNSISPFSPADPSVGEWYSVGSSLSSTGMIKYHILKMKKPGSDTDPPKFTTLCSISSRWYSCISTLRCFGVTERFLIFVEQPIVLSVLKMAATHMRQYAVKDWMEWVGEHEPNKFYVIEKSSGKIVMGENFDVLAEQSFNCMWTINAYEDGETIVMDMMTAQDEKIMHCEMDNLRKMENAESVPTQIKRFRIPLVKKLKEFKAGAHSSSSFACVRDGSGSSSPALLLKHETPFGTSSGLDFGKINKSFFGKKYKYFYSTPTLSAMNCSEYFGKLCKGDFETGDVITWDPNDAAEPDKGKRFIVGPPIFVPRKRTEGSRRRSSYNNLNCSEAGEEDDGVVVSTVLAVCSSDRNFLVVLDAKTFKEVFRAYFNEKIPLHIGGSYI